MKIFLILLFIPLGASADIFKCIENGKTIFSDSPCGDSARVIHIEPPVRSGTNISNKKLELLADELHTNRLKKEHEHKIKKQFNKIESIESDYIKKLSKLEDELTEHKASRNDYKWSGSNSKRDRYYKEKNNLKDKIAETKRKYRSDRHLAYLKLSQLKEKLRTL